MDYVERAKTEDFYNKYVNVLLTTNNDNLCNTIAQQIMIILKDTTLFTIHMICDQP